MTAPVLYDMTRAAWRRIRGHTPSGIDRVCDAYAAHFADNALAVLQVRGRAVVLQRAASARLFAALDVPPARFRREFMSVLGRRPWSMADRQEVRGAFYLNVGHSDFDLDAHWRSIGRLGLKPYYLLHDLIPLTHPDITTPHKTARHRGRVVKALTHAAGIIVNSYATQADLRAFAACQDIPLPPLLVAPIAGSNLPVPLHPAPSHPTGHDKPVFVSLGTIEARKNHMLLLRAWSLLIDRLGEAAPRLVLAGNWGLRSEQVRSVLEQDARLRNVVEVRTGLCDADVGRLLASARAVLLPTLAEGYGLPMVEALQMRVPVIASDLPSFREIGQEIPTLLDPNDAALWAEAIASFCDDGVERQRQSAAMGKFCPPRWDAHFGALDRWLANMPAHGVGETETSVDHEIDFMAAAEVKDREAQC